MKHIIYYSKTAPTSGKFNERNLKSAGRLDIAIHTFIAALFLSNDIRKDIVLHLVFEGAPNPPRHLEFKYNEKWLDFISKKDVAGLIKRMLYKYKKNNKIEVFSGCFIDNLNLLNLVKELKEQGKNIYILNKKGEHIKNIKLDKDSAFIIGDHLGMSKKDIKQLKKYGNLMSLGNKTYFASQSVVILNYELDNL